MQGRQDRTVVPASAEYIYDHVASPDKTLVWWDHSAHCITVDQEREAVWSRTAAWIAAHMKRDA
jgi:carboxylesterase